MKKILQTVATLGLFFLASNLVKAETALSTDIFTVGETVTITGGNFGYDKTGKSQICFKEESMCLTYGTSSSITEWTKSKIEFTVPYWGDKVYPSGRLYIYAGEEVEVCPIYSCYTTVQQVKVTDLPYTFEPLLYGFFNEEGDVQESFLPGQKVTISGFYFGDRGSLRIRTTKNKYIDSESWSDNKIEITIPEDYSEKELSLILKRGYDSQELPIEIPILGKVDGANDIFSIFQTYLNNHLINKLWELVEEKENIVVAVIDDGVYFNHYSGDLKSKQWRNNGEIAGNDIDDDKNGYIDDTYGWDFANNHHFTDISPNSHGTSVAAIIASEKNDNSGIAGISQKTKIMSLNVFKGEYANQDDIIKAIYYAANNGARVINLSLGARLSSAFSVKYNDAINYAWNKGVVTIIAGGNGDSFGNPIDTSEMPLSPVCNEGNNRKKIIGVGSVTGNLEYLSAFSNTGDCVDIYAQGEEVLSATLDDYSFQEGTSFSAPIISGIVAYMLSAYPEMSNEAVYDYIVSSSDQGVINTETLAENIKSYSSSSDTGNKWKKLYKKDTVSDAFKDIDTSHYKKAIEHLKNTGVVNGYQDGTFKPFNNISRAEFTKIIMETLFDNLQGADCFKDVKDEWFAQYVCKAKELGFINGYNDNSFKPTAEITVAESLKITFKAFALTLREPTSTEQWFSPILEYAQANNLYLAEFKNENFRITRDQMAEIIYRLQLVKNGI